MKKREVGNTHVTHFVFLKGLFMNKTFIAAILTCGVGAALAILLLTAAVLTIALLFPELTLPLSAVIMISVTINFIRSLLQM